MKLKLSKEQKKYLKVLLQKKHTEINICNWVINNYFSIHSLIANNNY